MDIRQILSNADHTMLLNGTIRAVDVALKHFNSHITHGALPESAKVTAELLTVQKANDVAELGSEAYDDGARAVVLLADAMVSGGKPDFLADFKTTKRVFLAFLAVLLQLILQLAHGYGKSSSCAAAQLEGEITTVRVED